MVPSMDQEAVEGAMDQEAIEGAMDQERAMDQEAVEGALDQEAVKGVMDGTTDGSGSSRRSDEWYQRWIRKQSKER